MRGHRPVRLPSVDGQDVRALGPSTGQWSLAGSVAAVRRVPAGEGVSDGFTHRTERETTLALVLLGYADGVPRAASNFARGGARRRRVAPGGGPHRDGLGSWSMAMPGSRWATVSQGATCPPGRPRSRSGPSGPAPSTTRSWRASVPGVPRARAVIEPRRPTPPRWRRAWRAWRRCCARAIWCSSTASWAQGRPL
ncbi:MAG: alanine racemase C-terminal domain-containing protein [Schumannella sp.]